MSSVNDGRPRRSASLVSEARPLREDELSQYEKELLGWAKGWMQLVLDDSASKKTAATEIDATRSGRVLFIDGPRGAGKTSMLLTLLEFWRVHKTSELHVFLPVLDFDPLPRGLPLHAWLLEPWRRHVQSIERKSPGVGAGDLTDRFSNLFDRVVSGWTPTRPEGKGLVEKTLEYEEQASGWLATHGEWSDFVGAMLCREHGCTKRDCSGDHQRAYIVPIDDVDLQVEQVPDLLNAIRLLRHPNVAYVLTGNFEHLRLALKLNYIGRHLDLLRDRWTTSDWARSDIDLASGRLSDAFLEKALPSHARMALKHLCLADVLKFETRAGLSSNPKAVNTRVEGKLSGEILTRIPADLKKFPIATARQVQHAVDRHLKDAPINEDHQSGNDRSWQREATLRFLADLCRTDLVDEQFTLTGELTTALGTILRRFQGDRLWIRITDQPRFVYRPNFEELGTYDDEVRAQAHQALLVQSLVETDGSRNLVAHALEWAPDAGILSTTVVWYPTSENVESEATFHWPWLVRPTIDQVLSLRDLAQHLSKKTAGNSRTDLGEEFVTAWLIETIHWFRAQKGDERPSKPSYENSTFECFDRELNKLYQECRGKAEDLEEIHRWARELCIMSAPYFGLPESSSSRLREIVKGQVDPSALEVKRLQNEQDKLVGDAMTARRTPTEKQKEPNEKERIEQTARFLKERQDRAPKDDWWKFVGFPPDDVKGVKAT